MLINVIIGMGAGLLYFGIFMLGYHNDTIIDWVKTFVKKETCNDTMDS